MSAGRTNFRRLVTDMDMTAVAALPAGRSGFHKNLTLFHIFEEFVVAVLMALFDFRNAGEETGKFTETFSGGDFGKFAVHLSPLLFFSGGGSFQI